MQRTPCNVQQHATYDSNSMQRATWRVALQLGEAVGSAAAARLPRPNHCSLCVTTPCGPFPCDAEVSVRRGSFRAIRKFPRPVARPDFLRSANRDGATWGDPRSAPKVKWAYPTCSGPLAISTPPQHSPPPTSAPGLGSPPPTSAPGLGPLRPHLRRGWAHRPQVPGSFYAELPFEDGFYACLVCVGLTCIILDRR